MWSALLSLLVFARPCATIYVPSWEVDRPTFLWDSPPTAETAFKNILLVVHCRLKVPGLSESICAEREPLFDGYRQYFGEVFYMTRSNCTHGDPQMCLAKLMKGRGAHRDGIFYMHFDSLIRPKALVHTFHKFKMHSFNEEAWCEINKTTLEQEHCVCAWWGPKRAEGYQKSIAKARNSGVPEFANLDPWQFWIANDDMFYVPRRLFKLYGVLADAFGGTHHEIAGPSMRMILENVTSVHSVNMGCTGGCCTHLRGTIALAPGFKCGHAFNLAEPQTRDAFPTAISTYREIPADAWRQMVQAVLE